MRNIYSTPDPDDIQESWINYDALQPYIDAQFLAAAPFVHKLLKIRFLSIKVFLILFVFALLSVAFFFGYLAYFRPVGSFSQAIFSEISASIIMFLTILYLIPIGLKLGWKFNVGLIVFSLVLGFFGYYFSGLTQSFLIEFSVGLSLFSALDYYIKSWLSNIRKAQVRARREMERHQQLIDETERDF
ncbi:hypothetical protein [Chroococcus sp. FPU101]|uniref:hypothetical protein n=1 Tax=Chroococcus sp. FPU101 TaxID=1974212 RepID=UPI001A8DE44C|nr:hypothetical protein [Chroococcus sp. FPU101]GFE72327.1 hypothetical protein CFPU101_49370 [Chroococcus sp. FPU101]